MNTKKASGGPRTVAGKAKTRFNALRHGLARCPSPAELQELESIAERYLGGVSDPYVRHFARLAAAADLEIERVQRARDELLLRTAAQINHSQLVDRGTQAIITVLPELLQLQRYEDRASA